MNITTGSFGFFRLCGACTGGKELKQTNEKLDRLIELQQR